MERSCLLGRGVSGATMTLSVLLVIALMACHTNLYADSCRVGPQADTTVTEAYPDMNYGTRGLLSVRWWGNALARSYVSFETDGLLPDGATMDAAHLWLNNSASVGLPESQVTVGVYDAAGPWDEHATTWMHQPGPETPPVPLDTNHFVAGARRNWVAWDVTASWAEAPRLDFVFMDVAECEDGWLIVDFYSREWHDAEQRPYLEVTYTPAEATPEPATWVLLACTGIAGALARRRRK